MDALNQIIQREVNKTLTESDCLLSAPATIIMPTGNEKYLVKILATEAEYELYNYSGSALEVGENVQIFYRHGRISPQTAYIGAAITRGSMEYVYGIERPTFSMIQFDSIETSCVICGNYVISGTDTGTVEFIIYVDDTPLVFVPSTNVVDGQLQTISFSLPYTLTSGSHLITININGEGEIVHAKSFVWGIGIGGSDSPYMPTSEEDYVYSINNGKATILFYISDYTKIIVPSTLEGYPVDCLSSTAFSYSHVQDVIIPSSVTKIE